MSLSYMSANLGGRFLIGSAGCRSLFLLGALLSGVGGLLIPDDRGGTPATEALV
jgi:hypothetical protein